jgi:hypothetical protein
VGRGVVSPVLKIARLGLPLESTRDLLEDLRTIGRRDVAEGMAKGLTADRGERQSHLMQRDASLLPAVHEGRHFTAESDEFWSDLVVARRIRGSSHRLSSGVTW